MKRSINFLGILILLVSCNPYKTMGDYGILDTKFICRNDKLKDSLLVLEIDQFEFIFDLDQFEQRMIDRNYGDFKSELKELKKSRTNENDEIRIVQFEDGYITQNLDTIYHIDSIGINWTLDELFVNGDFYLRSPKDFKCVEYRHWQPNYQGMIYSDWIVNRKSIKRIQHGSVN